MVAMQKARHPEPQQDDDQGRSVVVCGFDGETAKSGAILACLPKFAFCATEPSFFSISDIKHSQFGRNSSVSG